MVLTPSSVVHSELLLPNWTGPVSISALDIYNGFVSEPESFLDAFSQSKYAAHDFIVVDSGWYEKRTIESSLSSSLNSASMDWNANRFEQTIDELDRHVPALVVSGGQPRGIPYECQISRSEVFFQKRRQFASTILLRPVAIDGFHRFDELPPEQAGRLTKFDVVGITEKELGSTIAESLSQLAKLRTLLNECGVLAPIHVFGGLDPLYAPLLFAAGGEIFDGLGWLRYSYMRGKPFWQVPGFGTRWFETLSCGRVPPALLQESWRRG